MDYLRLKRRALSTIAFNLLFLTIDDEESLDITVATVVGSALTQTCVIGGTNAISAAMTMLASLPTSANISAMMTAEETATILTMLGASVSSVLTMNVSAYPYVKGALVASFDEDMAMTVSVTGRVFTMLGITVPVPISFTITMAQPLCGTEIDAAAATALAVTASVSGLVAAGKPLQASSQSTMTPAVALNIGVALGISIEADGAMTAEAIATTSELLDASAALNAAIAIATSCGITRYALLSDYDEIVLSSLDETELEVLDII